MNCILFMQTRNLPFSRQAEATTLEAVSKPMADDVLDFDPAHPIPYVESLDYVAPSKNGGIDLVFVIGSPLRADERSIKRMARKLETYADFIKRQRALCGSKAFRLIVGIHAGSDEQSRACLRQHARWFSDNNVDVEIREMIRGEKKQFAGFFPKKLFQLPRSPVPPGFLPLA